MMLKQATPHEPNATMRWAAVTSRDRQADGTFVYAVQTTGIYCRPSCPSRQPRREHVQFFDDATAAEAAGFRACKRCQPAQTVSQPAHQAAIVQACALIEAAATPPRLRELAAAVALSPAYFQRLFKQTIGLTPRQYAHQQRLRRLQYELAQGNEVVEAAYAAGFGSSSSLYAHADELGMAPATLRRGGAGEQICYALAPCDLGWILAATTSRGLCAIELDDAPEPLQARLRQRFPAASLHKAPNLGGWLDAVVALVSQPAAGLDLPLDLQGTVFQQRVWAVLRTIPSGSTRSYAEIANQLGQPTATRAVAAACAANALAIAIPCHRVVRSDGGLSGYRWGVERKRALLEREAAQRDHGGRAQSDG
ncbi:MAG: bifunctional DNA-binding transcriptional regulator/O6-methylguanine-DNA methyltransferase Ada [Oscillochloridaceae bacterium umkhey_bin13]